jgi:N-hydroxyarylamine O-acetyltransferase
MLLAVEADGGPWLADVGFGGSGPLLPLRLDDRGEQRQFLWSYRVAEEGGARVLQGGGPGGWQDFYAFTPEPQELVDYEVASYYVSTHPDSPFTRTLAAQLPTPVARYLLRNRELTVDRGTGSEARTVTDDELPEVLSKMFGLSLPAGVVLPDRPWEWGG